LKNPFKTRRSLRALGLNPRAKGTNARALEAAPRDLGTDARTLGVNPRALLALPADERASRSSRRMSKSSLVRLRAGEFALSTMTTDAGFCGLVHEHVQREIAVALLASLVISRF
jgi:hypothetical protein